MRLIILDRDGVINHDSPDYIKSPEEWVPIDRSLEAIAFLHQAGFTVTVATNQSGLARGYYTQEILEKIHAKMHSGVTALGGKIDTVFFCPHGPDNHCDCRKPKPGLLTQIAHFYQVSLNNVPFVGDSMRDLEAANAAGAKGILVLSGNGEKTLSKHKPELSHTPVYQDLFEFSLSLLKSNTHTESK